MHLLLTDGLTCPRCGPDFGLVLLADELRDRRVLEGSLGCPNCRDAFPVTGGFADLRAPPRGPLAGGRAGPPDGFDRAEAERLAALLGVVEGPGTVAFVGAPARHAAYWDEEADLQVVGIDPDLVGWPEAPPVNRIAAAPGLPFRSAYLRGLCIEGLRGPPPLAEAVRVVAPGGRLVVADAPAEAPDTLRDAGLEILAEEPGTVVGARA